MVTVNHYVLMSFDITSQKSRAARAFPPRPPSLPLCVSDSCRQLSARFHIYIKKGVFGGWGRRGAGELTEGVSNKKLMLHLLVYNNLMAVKDGHRHSHTSQRKDKD